MEDEVLVDFLLLFRKQRGNRQDVARKNIAALFDFLLNPDDLDHQEGGSTQREVDQTEAAILGFVRGEAAALRDIIGSQGGEAAD